MLVTQKNLNVLMPRLLSWIVHPLSKRNVAGSSLALEIDALPLGGASLVLTLSTFVVLTRFMSGATHFLIWPLGGQHCFLCSTPLPTHSPFL